MSRPPKARLRKTVPPALLPVLLSLLVSGCGVLQGTPLGRLLGSDEPDAEGPAVLQDFAPEVSFDLLWRTGVGEGAGDAGRLRPVRVGDTLYAASAKGRVTALDRHDGTVLWRVHLAESLSGGIGAGPDILLAASPDGEVFALDPQDGALLWESDLGTEILAPPATDGETVAVRTMSGKLHGLDAFDGTSLWVYSSDLPLLTLHGTSAPLVRENWVLAGFDNGQIAALDLERGEEQWRQRLARPEGAGIIDRLVDIDGDLLVTDEWLYAVSYQGQAGVMNWRRGQWLWRQPASSHVAPAAGLGSMYLVGDRGRVRALERDSGRLRWESNDLSLRELGAPAAFLSYLAVGDFEGYCHLLSQVDGRIVGRVRHSRDKISAAPLAVDDIVLYPRGGRQAGGLPGAGTLMRFCHVLHRRAGRQAQCRQIYPVQPPARLQ